MTPATPPKLAPVAIFDGVQRPPPAAPLVSARAAPYRRRMTSIDTEPGFDTLAYTQRLKAAGVEDKQAEVHAAAARDSQAGLATKADLDTGLAAVRAEIRGDLYRALWVQTGVIAGVVVAIVKQL